MGRIKRQHVRPAQSPMVSTSPSPRKTQIVAVDDEFETDSSAQAPTVTKKNKRNVQKNIKNKNSAAVEKFIYGLLQYGLDVLLNILSLLKWPLALLLTILLARFLLYRSLGRISGALTSHVRSGICAVPYARPFISTALPDFCSSAAPIDFANLVSLQQDSIEVAQGPVYAGSLPLQLKQAEMATSDLRTILAQSELSCKEPLDEALTSFSVHARDSGRAIQRTVVRVRGMVDAQLAMNEWAVSSLRRISDDKSSILGSLVPFVGAHDTRVSVTRTYVQAMDELSDYVKRLIEANEEAYESLAHLELDLQQVHRVIGLEKQLQKTTAEQVLSSLWSILGGNKKFKKIFKENLKILGDFEKGRVANKEVVAATSVAFNKMMYQIEYMRERIQKPGLVGDGIPIEVHIRNIELGIESLRGTREANRKESIDAGDFLLD